MLKRLLLLLIPLVGILCINTCNTSVNAVEWPSNIRFATEAQATEMINEFIVQNHEPELLVVNKDEQFADDQFTIVKQKLIDRVFGSCQIDPGMVWPVDTFPIAIVASWTRCSNDDMTGLPELMRIIRDMNLGQFLRAGVRSDLPNGQRRMCFSYMIYGLMCMAMFVGTLCPLVVDLQPGVPRAQGDNTDDFDPELGSVDFDPDVSNPIIKRILKFYRYIFLDGISVLQQFLNVIAKQGNWIVVMLRDEQMDMIDPRYNSTRLSHGGEHVIHFILMKNQTTNEIKFVAATCQVASAIAGPTTMFRDGMFIIRSLNNAISSFIRIVTGNMQESLFGFAAHLKNLTLGMLLYKDTASTLSAMLSESVLGIANVIFLPPCVVGGLKGIWQAVENYRHTMQRRGGGPLPTHEEAHSEMGRQGLLQAVENYRHTMQRQEGGDLPTFEDAHSEMSRQGLFQAIENYRHTMQRRDDGDLPTFEDAHSEMTRRGIFQAVENYRHTMQRREGGDLPTFEEAHSEMSRRGLFQAVENNRIAMKEHVSADVSIETALSVHQAICGAGNRGKPKSKSSYHPSSILMIEQFDDPGFVTPTPGSPDKPNRVYSLLNEDIAYALYQRGVVGSTNVAQSKIVSWVRQANENPGLVKYADLEIRSQKHNEGTSYFIRFTVLDVIPPTVVKAPKRPDSDKSRKRNKVIKDEVDSDDDGNGGGGVTMSIAQASSIKAAKKTKKGLKEANWNNLKMKTTPKKRTEAKDEKSSTGKKTKNAKTKKRKIYKEVDDEEKGWKEEEEEEEWTHDDN